jgi:hypothetical protein
MMRDHRLRSAGGDPASSALVSLPSTPASTGIGAMWLRSKMSFRNISSRPSEPDESPGRGTRASRRVQRTPPRALIQQWREHAAAATSARAAAGRGRAAQRARARGQPRPDPARARTRQLKHASDPSTIFLRGHVRTTQARALAAFSPARTAAGVLRVCVSAGGLRSTKDVDGDHGAGR